MELSFSFFNPGAMFWSEYFKAKLVDISSQTLFVSIVPICIFLFNYSPIRNHLDKCIEFIDKRFSKKVKFVFPALAYLFVTMPFANIYFVIQQTFFFLLIQLYYKFNTKKNYKILSYFFIPYSIIFLYFEFCGIGGLLYYTKAFVPIGIMRLLLNLFPAFFYYYMLHHHDKLLSLYDKYFSKIKKFYSFKKLLYVFVLANLIITYISPGKMQHIFFTLNKNHDLQERLKISAEHTVATYFLALKSKDPERAYQIITQDFNQKNNNKDKTSKNAETNMMTLQYFTKLSTDTDKSMGDIIDFTVTQEQCSLYTQTGWFGIATNPDQLIDFSNNAEFFVVRTNRQFNTEKMQIAVVKKEDGTYKISHITDCIE